MGSSPIPESPGHSPWGFQGARAALHRTAPFFVTSTLLYKLVYAASSGRVFASVWRQVDLAKALELTPSAISNLKRRQRCTIELLVAACRLTGKPVEWFLFGECLDDSALLKRSTNIAEILDRAPSEHENLARQLAVAEEQALYGDSRNFRTLLSLYEKRLRTLEDHVTLIETRLARLEPQGPQKDKRENTRRTDKKAVQV